MEYYALLVLAGMILAVIFIGVGVCVGGISEELHDRCDGDSVHSSGVPDSCDCNLGERDESINSGQDIPMDSETAVIALKVIKHDLHTMLSGTERRAIDYAIEIIKRGDTDDSTLD